MGNVRFLIVVAGAFFAVFFAGKWLLTIRPLQPDARIPTFQHVDRDDPRLKLEQSSVSDDDPTRDRLRNNVIDYAKALRDDPCNDVLKKNYIKAVVAYTRAWISIVPCFSTATCGQSDSPLLDRASHAFGTPLDNRVREAMQAAHVKAAFGSGDFPKDTVRLVSYLAADPALNSAPDTKEFRRVTAQLGVENVRQDCGH